MSPKARLSPPVPAAFDPKSGAVGAAILGSQASHMLPNFGKRVTRPNNIKHLARRL